MEINLKQFLCSFCSRWRICQIFRAFKFNFSISTKKIHFDLNDALMCPLTGFFSSMKTVKIVEGKSDMKYMFAVDKNKPQC